MASEKKFLDATKLKWEPSSKKMTRVGSFFCLVIILPEFICFPPPIPWTHEQLFNRFENLVFLNLLSFVKTDVLIPPDFHL